MASIVERHVAIKDAFEIFTDFEMEAVSMVSLSGVFNKLRDILKIVSYFEKESVSAIKTSNVVGHEALEVIRQEKVKSMSAVALRGVVNQHSIIVKVIKCVEEEAIAPVVIGVVVRKNRVQIIKEEMEAVSSLMI